MKKEKIFYTKELNVLCRTICEKTGYYFRDYSLLTQAFTRSSYSAECGGESNEILEFIGDQVLSYFVVKIIAERVGALNGDCEYAFRVRENKFTAIKQELVCNEALAKIIDEWGIAEYLVVGKSDFANEVDKQPKIKADLFEAIIGAIAVGSNWNAEILEKAVIRSLSIEEKLKAVVKSDYRPENFSMENAVSTLKELAEHGECTPPEYDYGTPENLGYDKDGNPIWACACSIINDKTGVVRQVWASSKKAAKRAAAYLVLCEHFELQNEYGENSKAPNWIYKDGKLRPRHMTDDEWLKSASIRPRG